MKKKKRMIISQFKLRMKSSNNVRPNNGKLCEMRCILLLSNVKSERVPQLNNQFPWNRYQYLRPLKTAPIEKKKQQQRNMLIAS